MGGGVTTYLLLVSHTHNGDDTLPRTRCYLLFYYTYDRLNMFRALLCPSSGAHNYSAGYSHWPSRSVKMHEVALM